MGKLTYQGDEPEMMAAAYADRVEGILAEIEAIKKQLHADNKRGVITWPLVGTLTEARRQLADTAAFLSGTPR